MPSQLDHLARQIGVRIDQAAIDRTLATVSLAGTTGAVAADVDAATLNAETAAAIKRMRWGGALRTHLEFIAAILQLREIGKSVARQRGGKSASAKRFARSILKFVDLTSDDDLLERLLKDAEHYRREWTNERIVGEVLRKLYAMFGKRPTTTRGGETVRFIQAVMCELDIRVRRKGRPDKDYGEETIIRAMTDYAEDKPKRRRRARPLSAK